MFVWSFVASVSSHICTQKNVDLAPNVKCFTENSISIHVTILLATIVSVFCLDFNTLMIYAAVFGFTVGAYVGLTSVILVDLLGLDKLTNAFGLLLLFQGIATFLGEFSVYHHKFKQNFIFRVIHFPLGPPIVGFLFDKTQSYAPGFLFAGVMIAFSGFILFFIPPLQAYLRTRQMQCNTDIAESAVAS